MGGEGFKWARVIADLERIFQTLGMPRHLEQLARFKAGYQSSL